MGSRGCRRVTRISSFFSIQDRTVEVEWQPPHSNLLPTAIFRTVSHFYLPFYYVFKGVRTDQTIGSTPFYPAETISVRRVNRKSMFFVMI